MLGLLLEHVVFIRVCVGYLVRDGLECLQALNGWSEEDGLWYDCYH